MDLDVNTPAEGVEEESSTYPRRARAREPGPLQQDLLVPHPVARVRQYFPQLRFMGSKYRLIPWIHEVLSGLEFDTALDAFAGSGAVAYLMKAMNKDVTSNDFLRFSSTINSALIENPGTTIEEPTLQKLLDSPEPEQCFIENTFSGIFFTPEDLKFLDRVWGGIRELENQYQRDLALAALMRACVKRQPRGVFTVSGDLSHYNDGRRDLQLSLQEHFTEQVRIYNGAIFSNSRANRSLCGDVFEQDFGQHDLVYLDPPYIPRADDNCYIKRYHFLEGLASYWEGESIMDETRVKKINKRYTPFSYRRDAASAFDRLFSLFADSTLVLSYSSNGYPDLETLIRLMQGYKKDVEVHRQDHRYHFGTHSQVNRTTVEEYLIIGTG